MEKYLPYGIMAITGLCKIANNFNIARLIPHVGNFSAVYGSVNYGSSMIKNHFLSSISILAMLFISDILIHFIYGNADNDLYPLYGWWMLYIYPVHLINGIISKYLVKEPEQIVNIGVTCTLTGFNFFMLSNLGRFIFTENDHSATILRKTYLDAIPFFPLTLISVFIFTGLFFGIHKLLFRRGIKINQNTLVIPINSPNSNSITL